MRARSAAREAVAERRLEIAQRNAPALQIEVRGERAAIRPSCTATGRGKRGTTKASNRTPSHSSRWRKDFQSDLILSVSLGRSSPR